MRTAYAPILVATIGIATFTIAACTTLPPRLEVVPLHTERVVGTWRHQELLSGEDLVISASHDGRFRVSLISHTDLGSMPPEESTAQFELGFLRFKEPMPGSRGSVAGLLLVSLRGRVVLITDAELPAVVSCASMDSTEGFACLKDHSFARVR